MERVSKRKRKKILNQHKLYMHRCLDLAKLAAGNVAPNPMVGAVLVYNEKIVGEGYHKKFGEAHAEVNCINNVKDEDRNFIKKSTLYVSLEPCSHFGKTPPCSDLIIKNKIPKVVIGCKDVYTEVDGKGIKKLQDAQPPAPRRSRAGSWRSPARSRAARYAADAPIRQDLAHRPGLPGKRQGRSRAPARADATVSAPVPAGPRNAQRAGRS